MSTTKEYQVILYTFSIEGELIKVDEKIPSFESELVYDLSCHPAVLGGVSRAYDVATLVQSIETVAGKVNKMSTLGMGGYNEVPFIPSHFKRCRLIMQCIYRFCRWS
jgi:hypothetical protein